MHPICIRTAGAALRFGFAQAGFNRICAEVLAGNAASVRVLEKCGYRPEGIARRYLCINGVWEDHLHLVRLNEPDAPATLPEEI